MRNQILALCLSAAILGVAQTPNLPEPMAQQEEALRMEVYPNPAADVLYVNWERRSLERMPVEVRSMDGKLVLLDVLTARNALNVGVLQPGLYKLFLMDLRGVRAQTTFAVVR